MSQDGERIDFMVIQCVLLKTKMNLKSARTDQLRCRLCRRKPTNYCSEREDPISTLFFKDRPGLFQKIF